MKYTKAQIECLERVIQEGEENDMPRVISYGKKWLKEAEEMVEQH